MFRFTIEQWVELWTVCQFRVSQKSLDNRRWICYLVQSSGFCRTRYMLVRITLKTTDQRMHRPPMTSCSKFNKHIRVAPPFPQKGKGTSFCSVAFSLHNLQWRHDIMSHGRYYDDTRNFSTYYGFLLQCRYDPFQKLPKRFSAPDFPRTLNYQRFC
jgi:hypothetical protein